MANRHVCFNGLKLPTTVRFCQITCSTFFCSCIFLTGKKAIHPVQGRWLTSLGIPDMPLLRLPWETEWCQASGDNEASSSTKCVTESEVKTACEKHQLRSIVWSLDNGWKCQDPMKFAQAFGLLKFLDQLTYLVLRGGSLFSGALVCLKKQYIYICIYIYIWILLLRWNPKSTRKKDKNKK